MTLELIREIRWDTIAKKFVMRKSSGKKIEVPLGGSSAGVGDRIDLQIPNFTLTPNADMHFPGATVLGFSDVGDTFELDSTNPASVLVKRSCVIISGGVLQFVSVSNPTADALISIDVDIFGPAESVGAAYSASKQTVDAARRNAVVGTIPPETGYESPASVHQTFPFKVEAGSHLVPLVSSGDPTGTFTVSGRYHFACVSLL